MTSFLPYLQGGDFRSISHVEQLLPLIQGQADFDALFQCLFSDDRLVAMRAADAIEKITIDNHTYLHSHKEDLINLLDIAQDKAFKWHLVLLVSRLKLTSHELGQVWEQLTSWLQDPSESRIVRVNSLQTLHDLAKQNKDLETDLELTIQQVENEKIPSLKARIKKLRGKAQ